jgi:hypothetical protein
MSVLNLNESQSDAYKNIQLFLDDKDESNFLLLGPAGAGKTTVIVNTFNNSTYRIAFCAFTNKATQILRGVAAKFNIQFKAEFMTIHKLLSLEPKYTDDENELSFKYDRNKVQNLCNYDIIIFDECSIISKEIYGYIVESIEYILKKYNHSIKIMYLGDYWQLPPVNEKSSIVFKKSIEERWRVSKLDKIMRSSNKEILKINKHMLHLIEKFKKKDVEYFHKEYPYVMFDKNNMPLIEFMNMIDLYIDMIRIDSINYNSSVVILSYSNNSCKEINRLIQDKINDLNNNIIEITSYYEDEKVPVKAAVKIELDTSVKLDTSAKPDTSTDLSPHESQDPIEPAESSNNITERRKITKINNIYNSDELIFFIGDRCCIDRPVEIFSTRNRVSDVLERRLISLDCATGETLYNGEIFDIIDVEPVYVKTHLNSIKYIDNHFPGQLLTIKSINDQTKSYQIIHIDEKYINVARRLIRQNEKIYYYMLTMKDFIRKYPKLTYGYCITVYKSQGSEWENVFVNMKNIYYSITGKGKEIDFQTKSFLFKTSYTALSRSSNKVFCTWNYS